jgi:hypothetical protein
MSNNNISDGPIPFFSGGDNQASFLSETNITNNTTTQNQAVHQTQSTQQQNTTTSKTTNQPLLDVSSIFGNSKEDSFLSSINNQGTELNNTNINTNSQIPSTFPNSNSLYYNQTNNGSTASLNQSYNSYIPNSNSNPQSVNSSNTNLSSFNQTNNTNTTGNTNSKIIPNKSPYISSPEPNATSYITTGTTTNNYTQGFYLNQANKNSSSNLSSNAKNNPINGSTSSLNQTQTYSLPNYSNYQSSYSSYNTNSANSYLSPSSKTNSGAATPVMAKTALNTTSYGTNTVSSGGYSNNTTQNSTSTTTGYTNTVTSSAPTTEYTNAATGTTTTGYTNTQAGTATSINNYMNTQNSTTTPAVTSTTSYPNGQTSTANNTSTTYPNTQSNAATVTNLYSTQVSNTGYSTHIQASTSTYPMTSSYQAPQTNTTTGGYSTQANTTNSTYGAYPQTTNTSTNNNLLNPSASYSSLNTLTSTYNTSTTAATTNVKPTDTTSIQNIGQKAGITNFGNDSSSQLNYYNMNTINNTSTNNSVNVPSIRSNTPGANSINDLPATTATVTNGTNTSTISSSLYYQNKNSQKFYSNSATSNSSPCLNSMNMSYPGNNENNVKKSTYDTSGKHVKANSVLSPSSTYQNSLYNANTTNNVDNASYNGSVNSKNEVPASGSSLYYHEDNNGKFRSPTAPPSSGSNASNLSPSPTNPNLNRPPSVPPNYGSYNYGTNTSTATTAAVTTTSWNNSTTPSMNYSSSSYTTPANSTYASTTYPASTTPALYQLDTTANSTYRPTSTTPNPYQSDAASGIYGTTSTTPNPYQSDTASGVYRPSSTTPNPYQSDTASGVYRPSSTTPNPYQPSTTPNPYQSDATGTYRPTSTTPNPYQTSTTPNPYQSDISNNQNNFYNFDNQSQSEMHSYDPIVMHQNLSPIVTFGFGGKLVVMFPKDLSGYGGNTIGPNSVHVKPISSLIYQHVIEANKEHEGPILGQKKNKKQILEMINKKINKIQSKNNQYSNYSSVTVPDSDEVLILKIIQLYIENDGVLYGQNSKSEAVQSLRNLLLTNEPAPLNVVHSMINGPSINSSEIENIKNCLLQGDRPGACKIAVNNKLWAHALIIASYINKETYKDVVNSFIKSELQGENDSQRSSFQSIKVLYSLFAGMGKDAIGTVAPSTITNSISAVPTIQSSTTSSTTNISDIVGRWKEILGMILSNRTPNDITAIVSLGDTLLSSGKLFAAHLCYLFSPSSISGLGNKNTKAVILGADHLKNKKFYQDLSAFEMTEFLEYMYYLANKNLSTMPHFQAYKLAYASWLSEIGLVTKAFSYTQCIMQIVKSGTNNNSNGTTSTSLYYNSTFIESLKEFSSRCQGNLNGTKNAPKDGWFSKITKFDTFLEAFDHGLNKFIGTTENENAQNLNNTTSTTSTTKPQVPNPVAMMPASTISNVPSNSNVGITNSSSYQSLNQTYYNNSYSTDNLSNLGSRRNSFSKGEQKGVFSLIGNLFNKNGGSTSNNSSTTSLNQDESNKNGYYDSMTKQWVTTNPQNNDNFGKDISAPPPVASDSYYNSGYNSNNNGMINNNSTTAGTLSNGVIPQFGTMGTTNGVNNSRRNNRNKYNDPTLNLAYSNTNTQANATSTLYSNNSTVNQSNTSYNAYNWNNYGN